MTNYESSIRERLDNWRLWVGVAYFGLAAVVVALFFINRDISRQQADSAAKARSASATQVRSCVDAVRNKPDVDGLLDAIRFNIADRITVTVAANEAAAADDPLTNVRASSLTRLHDKLDKLDAFIAKVNDRTPTRSECNEMAVDLGLNKPFPKAAKRKE